MVLKNKKVQWENDNKSENDLRTLSLLHLCFVCFCLLSECVTLTTRTHTYTHTQPPPTQFHLSGIKTVWGV